MKKNYLIFLAGICCVAIVGIADVAKKYELEERSASISDIPISYVVQKPEPSTSRKEEAPEVKLQQQVTQAIAIDEDNTIPQEKLVDIVTPKNNDAKKFDYDREWEEARGIFRTPEKMVYHGFDIDTLQRLALAGDMLAHQILALKSLDKGEIKEAKDLLRRSMRYGDIEAIRINARSYGEYIFQVQKGNMSEAEAMKSIGIVDYNGTLERLVLLHKYALSYVLSIRGDNIGAKSSQKSIQRNLKFPFTKKEIEFSKEFAFSFYEKLAQEREALILQPFDNTQKEAFGGQETDTYHEYFAKD